MTTTSRPARRGIAYLVYLAVSLSLVPVASQAEDLPAAQDLINDMSRAVRTLNYDGTFIYRRNRQMDAMRLVHKADSTGEYERLLSLTGMPREVIRNNESVTCIFPENQAVMVEKSRPRKFVAQLPEPIEKISDYYSFTTDGEDRVAGRDAWVVNIRPRDVYRYGYELWIDKDSKLLLKSELKNKSGFPLEQIMFTDIKLYQDIPDELLKPSISGKGYTWYHQAAAEERKDGQPGDGWHVTWMPDGFSLKNHERQMIKASHNPLDHMVFSDGLASVSIFIEKLPEQPDVSVGPTRMGGVNAFARFANGFQVTAVGEVPQATVQRMANSVISER